MPLSRMIARPLLASMFIAGGLDAIRHPEGKAKAAQAVTVPLSRRLPALPDDPELLVQVNGAVQVGAGALLALGRFRRLAAIALIGSIIPTTYAGHRFWEEEDEAARTQQQIHFLKNLGLLGGLILAAFDTEGAPSVGWRARRRAASVASAVAVGRAVGSSSARSKGSSVAEGASRATHHARDVAGRATHQVDLTARHLGDTLPAVGHQLADTLPSAGHQLADTLSGAGQSVVDTVSSAAHSGADALTPYVATATDRAGDLVGRAQELLDR